MADKVDDEAQLARAQHPDLARVDLEDRRGLELGELAGELRSLGLQLGQGLLLGAERALGGKVPADRPDIAESDRGEQACEDNRAWTRRERTPKTRVGRDGPRYVLGTPPASSLLPAPVDDRRAIPGRSAPSTAGYRSRNAPAPEYVAAGPSSSSIRSSWLYLATRSLRDGAPVLI